MTRRIACTLTIPQVRQRIKTVTRRAPDTWRFLKSGEHLILIEKGMGLKKGEKQVVLNEVRTVSNYCEPLSDITPEDVAREGFPDWTPEQFIAFYCTQKGGDREQIVRRIEWEYL